MIGLERQKIKPTKKQDKIFVTVQLWIKNIEAILNKMKENIVIVVFPLKFLKFVLPIYKRVGASKKILMKI